jgi:hypothetical protein
MFQDHPAGSRASAPIVGCGPTRICKYDANLTAARASLLALKRQVAALAFELKFKRLLREKAYNPNQPRVPAGNPDGGQWTSEGGHEGRIRVAQIGDFVTDADGKPYYQRGGHHEMPEGVQKSGI